MITVKPFRALRPIPELVKDCAALPYDVMSREEAYREAKDNPYSFLHVDKAEIDLDPSVDGYDPRVYAKAADNLRKLETDGTYQEDEKKRYYFYRQIMDGRAQTGIVGCASIDDYLRGAIKKHELTRADKEADRIRHVTTCAAHTGPIFLAYRESETLDLLIERVTLGAPLYDFTSDDGIRHTVWTSDGTTDRAIESAFQKLDALYIADGHHRAASAVRAGLQRREEEGDYTGEEEFNYFLSVVFPANSLKIFDYNRLLLDLNGLDKDGLLAEIERTLGKVTKQEKAGAYRPKKAHEIGLYVEGAWYQVEFRAEICQAEKPSERLDCSILQREFLASVLGINDPRTDKRIDFVGGIRGLEYLESRCKEDAVAAIAMYPTSLEELMTVADAGEIMPPKSTWFEPKLRSGIFINKI